jgi:ankyrin repeat protein
VNTKTDKPLHLATLRGEKEIVELLIAAGAEVNASDGLGQTALDKAKRKPETADLLRKHGGKTGEELKAEQK